MKSKRSRRSSRLSQTIAAIRKPSYEGNECEGNFLCSIDHLSDAIPFSDHSYRKLLYFVERQNNIDIEDMNNHYQIIHLSLLLE